MTTASATFPLPSLSLGPVGVNLAVDVIEIFRLDRRDRPMVVFQVVKNSTVFEASLVAATHHTAVVKIIGRTTREEIDSLLKPFVDAAKQSIQHPRIITREELETAGYSLLWTDDDEWNRLRQGFSDGQGRIHLTIDNLTSALPDLWVNSRYSPDILDRLSQPKYSDVRLLAFHSAEDLSDALWIQRRPSGDWMAYSYLSTPPDLRTRILDEMARSPRVAYAIQAIVENLGLEDWMDMERVRSVYSAARGFAEKRPYTSVAVQHHHMAYDIEHFHSVGTLASSAGVGAVSPEDVSSFILQLREHTVSRLIENAELALGLFRRRLADAMYGKAEQVLYNAINDRNPRDPMECLKALKAAGVIDEPRREAIAKMLFVPTQLRHLWTHSGHTINSTFFDHIKISKENRPETVKVAAFGRTVALRIGDAFDVTPEDIKWLSLSMTSLVDDLCEKLEGRWPIGST